jgi:peptide/nickel transport system substrate-binding protein
MDLRPRLGCGEPSVQVGARVARLVPFLTFIVVAACAVSDRPGIGGDPDAVPAEERYGGTAVMGMPADLQTMSAFAVSTSEAIDVQIQMLFMTLVRYDENLEPRPWLDLAWDTVRVAPDTLQITFRLRQDVHWHDGAPTTAEDVRFTFNRITDLRTGAPRLSFWDRWSRAVEVVDPHTIRFRFRPHADFMDAWTDLAIMPAHRFGDVPPEELMRHPFGTSTPVGNGAFRFVRRLPGQEWIFEANPDFPADLGGRPYLDRLVFRVIPGQTTLLTELLTGAIDLYVPQFSQMEQLRSASGIETRSSPGGRWAVLGWNTLDPMFADARVRRALSLAIDRETIVAAALHGYGEPGVSTSTPRHWVFDDAYLAQRPTVDTAEARRLLAEAGWRPGRDESLHDARGQPLRFTLLVRQDDDTSREVGQIVQAQLRRIGVRAEVRLIEWNTLVELAEGTPLPGGGRRRDFQAMISRWTDGVRKADAAVFHSRSADSPLAETGFSSPRTDVLLDTLDVLMDREQARPLWGEYHDIMLRESPYAVLYYPHWLLANRERLRGIALDVRGELAYVREWWIHPVARTRPGTFSAGAEGS